MDKSGADTAAIVGLCVDSGVAIEMRQSKYLNNLVEQDHRAIKRVVRPMPGFKSFRCARAIISGIQRRKQVQQFRKIFERLRSSASPIRQPTAG